MSKQEEIIHYIIQGFLDHNQLDNDDLSLLLSKESGLPKELLLKFMPYIPLAFCKFAFMDTPIIFPDEEIFINEVTKEAKQKKFSENSIYVTSYRLAEKYLKEILHRQVYFSIASRCGTLQAYDEAMSKGEQPEDLIPLPSITFLSPSEWNDLN